MNSEFVKKVALYKELFDAKTISEEQYLAFIKEVVNEQTKEAVENKDLSFETKREELVEENKKKSQELKDRIKKYERQHVQEYEIAFAIKFLSQIYDSYGNRVYPDELLQDETKLSLYEMQNLIENIKNNAPKRYNEIVSKIDPSKVIELEEPSVENNENEENETKIGLPESYSNYIANNTEEDLTNINSDANVNNEPEVVDIKQPEPTISVDLTSEEKAKNDFEEYMAKNGITDKDNENTSELLKEEAPKRPKLITRAKDALMNNINSKNGKIDANLAKILLVVGGVVLGVATLGASGIITAAAVGTGGALLVGAASEYIKKVK